MARRRRTEIFPAPLQQFAESEWPPVGGECLGRFACRGEGYGTDCVPGPGESCGQLFYATLGPGRLAAERRADAVYRWRDARLSWLGRDHPGYLDEFLDCYVREDYPP
jgi:hypothetical protein